VDLGLRGPGAAAGPPRTRAEAKAASEAKTASKAAGSKAAGSKAAKFAPASTAAGTDATAAELAGLLDDAQAHLVPALRALVEVTGAGGNVEKAAASFRAGIEAVLRLPDLGQERLCAGLVDEWTWVALIGRLVSRALTDVAGAGVFRDLGLDDGAAWRLVALIRMLGSVPLPSSVAELSTAEQTPALVRALIANEAVRPYIRVNVWEGVSWFNRESFGQVLWWMLALDALAATADEPATAARTAKRLQSAERMTSTLAKAAKACGYQLDKLEAATRT
jgi:hypothetical protein